MLIACLSTLTITRAENEAKEAIQVIQHPSKYCVFVTAPPDRSFLEAYKRDNTSILCQNDFQNISRLRPR